MANNISGAVWRIDTLPFTYNAPVKLVNVSWSDQTAAGDSLVIQTVKGNPIIDTKASSANYMQNFGFLGWVPSLTVTTKTSGVVLISVGAGR